MSVMVSRPDHKPSKRREYKLADGTRVEAVGSYSGIRSRGLSLLTIRRLQALAAARKSTPPTEFSTPLFGGSGGTRSYNLDCGNQSVLVGAIGNSGSWIDAIGIICQQVNAQTGALGNEFTRGPVGGSGGYAYTWRCNQALLEEKSVLFFDGLTFLWHPWLHLRGDNTDGHFF